MEALGAALLADPGAFSEAAKGFVEALGGLVDVSDKAISTLTHARTAIASSVSEHTVIVNLTDVEHTWYCYNDMAPVKHDTQFRSHMGAYCTITAHCIGYGAMGIFKDNEDPAYCV